MADKDLGDGPSLELPKLFGRKKDKKRHADDDAPPAPTEQTPDEQAPTAPPSAAPVPEEPEPPAPHTPSPEPGDPAEVTMPLPVPAPSPEPAPEPEPAPAATRADTPAVPPEPATEPDTSAPAGARKERRARTEPRLPAMPTGVAAVLVGALVAALGIGLTWLGLLGCEALRGTESCGGPGLLVMLAIMVAMVVSGAALLKALGVPQSGSLSFLGFGILAVVVLMFLLEHLYEPWVLVSLPVISAAGYAIAHWVTTRFTEPDPDFTH